MSATLQTVPPQVEEARKCGGWWRALVVAIVLVTAMLAIHLTPVRAWLSDADLVRANVASLGVWMYPTAIVATALLLAAGVPRLPIHAAGGMIFGVWLGLTLTVIGAILGHSAVFCFVGWGGRDWVIAKFPKVRKWADVIHQGGIVGVLLARQLPAHAMLINICLALANVKHSHFLLGTAIGLLPEAIPATLVGAGLVKSSLKDSAGYLALAAASFAIIWIVAGYGYRAMRRAQQQAPHN